MAKLSTLEVYRLYGDLCMDVERELLQRKTLQSKWRVTAGLYPNDQKPEGAGVQFFRPNWFNEDGKGLHFETWVKKSYHEKGEIPFVLHIEVGKARAGFGQKDFRDLFLEKCGDTLVKAGYVINPKFAMEPVKCQRATTPETFVKVAVKEFVFLSKLGNDVDSIIKELKA